MALGIRPAPSNHSIYGEHGIMHGIALTSGAKPHRVTDPTFTKKEFRAFGHNGLNVGQWFACQHVALLNGAHGSIQGGISGTQGAGAYSVVVSAMYDNIDQDLGQIVHYSGSKAHTNTNPNEPEDSSSGTKALKASMGTGEPVRLLRSASGKSRFSPACGIRYDGLYQVKECVLRTNANGGAYEQFRLERMADQPCLAALARSPSAEQIRDFGKIKEGY